MASPLPRLLLAAAALGLGYVGYRLHTGLDSLLADAEARQQADADWRREAGDTLSRIESEITRLRMEQRVGGQGPQALMQMLRSYADAMVNARTTAPDYLHAQEQMRALLRAFTALGQDGVAPLTQRFASLDPLKDFDEMRWILEALVACDAEKGKQLVVQVLLGRSKPNPRLRWAAADLLLRADKSTAQSTLRQVLLTETSRGIDPDRAAAYGASILDPAAIAATGFFNFVLHYLRSEDPQAEETLLQVLARPMQDVATLQETIEALGSMRSARAQKRIEELYLKPPGAQQNPLFLNKCLDALVAIRGKECKPWLQQQLAAAEHELVVQHVDRLIQELDGNKPAAPAGAATPGDGK